MREEKGRDHKKQNFLSLATKISRVAWEERRWSHGWYVWCLLACWWWAKKLEHRQTILNFLIHAIFLLHLQVVRQKLKIMLLLIPMIEVALQFIDVVEIDVIQYQEVYFCQIFEREKIKIIHLPILLHSYVVNVILYLFPCFPILLFK